MAEGCPFIKRSSKHRIEYLKNMVNQYGAILPRILAFAPILRARFVVGGGLVELHTC